MAQILKKLLLCNSDDDGGSSCCLPLPSHFSSSSSRTTQTIAMPAAVANDDASNIDNQTPPSSSTTTTSTSMESILMKLCDSRISERQEALAALTEYARNDVDSTWLCHPITLAAVIYMLNETATATAASAFILNLSAAPSNSVKIVQFPGSVAHIVDTLKNPQVALEARDNAACALLNLALQETNKVPIGSTRGAIPVLVEHLCDRSASHLGRNGAGMALNHLVAGCFGNLAVLAETAGVAEKMLGVAADRGSSSGEARRAAMVVMAQMAGMERGRTELVAAGAVREMVRMLREGEDEGVVKWCLDVMHAMCEENAAEFGSLAVAAGAKEVLEQGKGGWGYSGRRLARSMLSVLNKRKYCNSPKPLEVMKSVVEGMEEKEEEEEAAEER